MNLLITNGIANQFVDALQQAGSREIGGIMMGEHVSLNTFRVEEITIQMHGGAFAAFVRMVESILNPLRQFFERTSHEYTRHNYIGEWHSHPAFALTPSKTDTATMLALLHDHSVGANFAALLLVKLSPHGVLEHSLTVFQKPSLMTRGVVVIEAGSG